MRFIRKVIFLLIIGLIVSFFVAKHIQKDREQEANQPRVEQEVQPQQSAQQQQPAQQQQQQPANSGQTTDQKINDLKQKGISTFEQIKSGFSELLKKLMPLAFVVGGIMLGYFIINDL